MFNNSSHIDASHSTFSQLYRDQYYHTQSTVQGNQTVNTVVYGNQFHQDSHSNIFEVLQKASAPSATYNSVERYPAPKCIEGTRVELLARLTSWIDEPDEKPICWLNGGPGLGKSAVSQTIAEMYADRKRLAASFFFSRRDLERRCTRHVVSTLTMQLLSSLPSIRPAVVAALENDYMIPTKVLREQMEKLLLGPVSTATEIPDVPIVIVVDALDECDEEDFVLELVTLFTLLPQRTVLPLRLLVTSRSKPWLRTHFNRPDISSFTLPLEIYTFSAVADIRLFLQRALDDTYDTHLQVMKDVPRPWPSSRELDRITNKACGLFIFALTVVKFVGDKTYNPTHRLRAILGDEDSISTGSAYADLDSLYRDAISVFPDPDVARLVLGLVYCMMTPLSISGLHGLLQRPDVDARLVVPALSSVLLASEDGKQPIQFYHSSFRDFLINPQRSREYAIDPDSYHRLMAQLCLETMSNGLKRDMCKIGDPARANKEVVDLVERRQAAFGEALVYACRFWSHHLARLPKDGVTSGVLLGVLRRFSTTVLLCWIEAMSIFGELEATIVMLCKGISWLKTLHETPKDVLTLLEDADRLVMLHKEPISQCALHVHLTAISFTPTNSAIYQTFKGNLPGMLTVYPRGKTWGTLRTELDLHHPIHCTVFSPDDEVIATAGVGQGVQIWNTVTGGNVASLGDCSSTTFLVSFSPSGTLLAAAFEGGTVIVWDPKVGREHLKHEGCHSAQITCIEFSKNSVLLASGARDHAIRVWSMETAQALYHLAIHEGPVTSLVFSSDSQWLFSGSEDNLAMMWDMLSGKLARRMMGHRRAVNCVAVSKNAGILASGSEDKNIKLWDTHSGKCTQTFSKGHHAGIRIVHFFDEDKYLITACDGVVLSRSITSHNTPKCVWTTAMLSRKMLKYSPMRMFGWAVPNTFLRLTIRHVSAQAESSVAPRLMGAFATQSPSFVFAAQGSLYGGSIQAPMSDVTLGGATSVTSIAVSSYGNWVVTASPRGSLQILSAAMPRKTWENMRAEIKLNPQYATKTIVPSPTGTRFIVKSLTRWALVDEKFDVMKGIKLGSDIYRFLDTTRFKFSPDGSIFCSLVTNLFNEDKNTLRVYDATTGEQRVKFSNLKKVQSFAASTGGAWAACGHGNGQVTFFGVTDRQRATTAVAEVDGSPVQVLYFSDDGKTLVAGSQNGVVRVWDRSSMACKTTLRASTSAVTAVTHVGSSTGDDAYVAIGREDGSVCVWSPSRSTSHNVVCGDQAAVEKVDVVRFTDDRKRLISRGEDGTVFTWAISFDTNDVGIAHCMLCSSSVPQDQQDEGAGNVGSDIEGAAAPPSAVNPHFLLQSNPGDAPDSFFHTAYRVRKDDGWLVHGERRLTWIPPSYRPSGKDALFAFPNGIVVFFSPARELLFFRVDEVLLKGRENLE